MDNDELSSEAKTVFPLGDGDGGSGEDSLSGEESGNAEISRSGDESGRGDDSLMGDELGRGEDNFMGEELGNGDAPFHNDMNGESSLSGNVLVVGGLLGLGERRSINVGRDRARRSGGGVSTGGGVENTAWDNGGVSSSGLLAGGVGN